MQKRSYKNLTCFNKAADWSSDGHRAITRSAFCRSSVSYRWTSSSKKSKPEEALTSRKRRYCTVVELTILRETTPNRTASKFFNSKSSASRTCKQKIGTFYWINDFLYFFERDIRWTRKIKTVTRSNRTAVFSPFCNRATAVLRNGIRNIFVFYCIRNFLKLDCFFCLFVCFCFLLLFCFVFLVAGKLGIKINEQHYSFILGRLARHLCSST